MEKKVQKNVFRLKKSNLPLIKFHFFIIFQWTIDPKCINRVLEHKCNDRHVFNIRPEYFFAMENHSCHLFWITARCDDIIVFCKFAPSFFVPFLFSLSIILIFFLNCRFPKHHNGFYQKTARIKRLHHFVGYVVGCHAKQWRQSFLICSDTTNDQNRAIRASNKIYSAHTRYQLWLKKWLNSKENEHSNHLPSYFRCRW